MMFVLPVWAGWAAIRSHSLLNSSSELSGPEAARSDGGVRWWDQMVEEREEREETRREETRRSYQTHS